MVIIGPIGTHEMQMADLWILQLMKMQLLKWTKP